MLANQPNSEEKIMLQLQNKLDPPTYATKLKQRS